MRFGRWGKVATLAAVVALAGVNAAAYFHAEAMIEWKGSGTRTRKPEDLSTAERVRVLLTGVDVPRPTNARTPGDLGLAFDVVRFPNGQGDELEAWHIGGDSAGVVFVVFPGYAVGKDTMLPVAEGLHGMGYDVLLVDFYGAGGSSGTDTALGVREALDVTASLAFARREWPESRVVLYGESMGAAAILRAVARHGATPDAVVLEAAFDRLLSAVAARFRVMNLPASPFSELLVFWGSVGEGIDFFDHNPVDDAARVACPALVLHGTRDSRVTREQAESIYERLGGWKRFSEFEEAMHGGGVVADRAQWEADVALLVEATVEM